MKGGGEGGGRERRGKIEEGGRRKEGGKERGTLERLL